MGIGQSDTALQNQSLLWEHQYRCLFDGKYAIFRVPTLADMPSNSYTIVNRGFLAGSIDFEENRASNVLVDFINFDDKDTISFERKLNK